MDEIDNDQQFQESVITEVTESDDYYSLNADGFGIGCPKVEGLPTPRIGETMKLYGRGFGYPVRGISVGGRVYRYRTESQHKEDSEAEQREREAKREADLEASLPETDRRIAALPEIFQQRLAKFQRDGGHKFRRDYEGYELFCCEQAVAFADALRTIEAITAFHSADNDEQVRLVPALSDQHSGNTFATACMLAKAYVEAPEIVAKLHGALSQLVGCEDYGCKHPEVSL